MRHPFWCRQWSAFHCTEQPLALNRRADRQCRQPASSLRLVQKNGSQKLAPTRLPPTVPYHFTTTPLTTLTNRPTQIPLRLTLTETSASTFLRVTRGFQLLHSGQTWRLVDRTVWTRSSRSRYLAMERIDRCVRLVIVRATFVDGLMDWVRLLVLIPPRSPQPQLKPSLMSPTSPPVLERLRRLKRSSPDFHDQVCNVLYEEEYQKCVPNLQGDDSTWLVEYLDKVRRYIALPHPPAQTSVDS